MGHGQSGRRPYNPSQVVLQPDELWDAVRKQVITHPSSAQALRPVADQSLNTVIGDRLKDFILREKLRPGDKLPTEGVLAERLQVSRTAIREAMRGLEALGMVEARQGSGRVVSDFNFDAILDSLTYGMVFHSHTIRQVTEVRKALDAFFADHMVANVTETDLRALRPPVQLGKPDPAVRLRGPQDRAAGAALTDRGGPVRRPVSGRRRGRSGWEGRCDG